VLAATRHRAIKSRAMCTETSWIVLIWVLGCLLATSNGRLSNGAPRSPRGDLRWRLSAGVAERFGMSRDAVQRHAQNHIPPRARAAILAARAWWGGGGRRLKRDEACATFPLIPLRNGMEPLVVGIPAAGVQPIAVRVVKPILPSRKRMPRVRPSFRVVIVI
jgi:hypothetical protein